MMASQDVLLAEYRELKAEQRARIGMRDSLLYAAFTAVAAVIAAVATTHAPALLLAAPPVMQVLGWTYLSNDLKVTQIGGYIRRELAPGLGEDALGWERWSGRGTARRTRRRYQLAVDLAAFPLASVAVSASAVIAQSLHPGTVQLLLVAAWAVAESFTAWLLGLRFITCYRAEDAP